MSASPKNITVIATPFPDESYSNRLLHTTYSTLQDLQGLVDGYIEIVPHKDGSEGRFMAYVNEEGMLKELPANDLGALILEKLGFVLWSSTATLFGPIILMGKNEKSLTKKDRELIETTMKEVVKECGIDEREAKKQRVGEEKEDE